MYIRILAIFLLLLTTNMEGYATVSDSLLKELDHAIELRPTYIANKERNIQNLRKSLEKVKGKKMIIRI